MEALKPMRLLERLPPLTVRQFAFVAIFTIGFIAGSGPMTDYDGWWHLSGGRLIAEQGGVSHVDPFSYTMRGQEWVMHEWAWELILFGIYALLGPLGAILLKALVAGLTFAAMLHLALRRGASTLVALLAVVLAIQAVAMWINVRPQVIQPLFVLAALHLMQSHREGKRRVLLWYPVLMVVWVNFHGSFPLGGVLFVLFGVCELLRIRGPGLRQVLPTLTPRPAAFLAAILILCVVACFLGPNGARGALYPLDYMGGKLKWATDNITEWKSPNWHKTYLTPLFAVLLLTFAMLALSPVSPAPFDLLSVLLGTYMMLKWARNGPLFVTLATPVLAVHLSAWTERVIIGGRSLEAQIGQNVDARRPLVRCSLWAVAVALVVMAAVQVPWRGELDKVINVSRYPTKAAEVIAQNDLKGNMFNVYRWGGYLIWRFYGERLVFIDGRADVYGEAMWDDYRQVSRGKADWKRVLDKHKVQYALVEADWPVCQALDLCPSFTRIYGDAKARLYVRNKGVNAPVLRRFKAGKLVIPTDDLPSREAILW